MNINHLIINVIKIKLYELINKIKNNHTLEYPLSDNYLCVKMLNIIHNVEFLNQIKNNKIHNTYLKKNQMNINLLINEIKIHFDNSVFINNKNDFIINNNIFVLKKILLSIIDNNIDNKINTFISFYALDNKYYCKISHKGSLKHKSIINNIDFSKNVDNIYQYICNLIYNTSDFDMIINKYLYFLLNKNITINEKNNFTIYIIEI